MSVVQLSTMSADGTGIRNFEVTGVSPWSRLFAWSIKPDEDVPCTSNQPPPVLRQSSGGPQLLTGRCVVNDVNGDLFDGLLVPLVSSLVFVCG
jgi:hypothetical protein